MLRKTLSVLLAALLLFSVVPLSAIQAFAADGEEPTALLNEVNTAEINSGEQPYFKFIPAETAAYIFYSVGGNDTLGYLCDSAKDTIVSDDDSGENYNFRISRVLTAGETYYLSMKFYGSGTGSIDFYIVKAPAVESFALNMSQYIGLSQESFTLYADEFSPSDAYMGTLSWSSDNESTAEVDDNGNVSLISAGSAVITATEQNGATAQCSVTVAEAQTLYLNQTATVAYDHYGGKGFFEFTPSQDGYYLFTSSGNVPVCADLDGMYDSGGLDGTNFKLRCELSGGVTYIIKTSPDDGIDEGDSYQVTVSKIPPASGMTISQGSSLTGTAAEEIQLSVSFTPEICVEESVSWESSDSGIAEVDSYGLLTLKAEGTATITATSENGLTAQCLVSVQGYDEISDGETKLVSVTTEGKNTYFSFTPDESGEYVYYSEGSYDTYGYLLDSELNQISGNDDGGSGNNFKITADLEKGNTYILRSRMYYTTTTGEYSVTVKKVIHPTSIAFSQAEYTGRVNSTVTVEPVFYPEGAVEEGITYELSDGSVADWSYDNSFSLNSPGSTVVTATTESGLTASFTITVEDYELLSFGDTKTVVIKDGEPAVYRIETAQSCAARIYSEGSGEYLSVSLSDVPNYDMSRSGHDFEVTADLDANTTSYITITQASYARNEFELHMELLPGAESFEFSVGSEITAYAKTGFISGYTFYPEGSRVERITSLSSSNEAVAEISDDSVIFKAAGDAVLTAVSQHGLTAALSVHVLEPEALAAGDLKSLTLAPDIQMCYRITPDSDAVYELYSKGNSYAEAELLDDSLSLISSESSSHGFSIQAPLEQGGTYYLRLKSSSSEPVTLSVGAKTIPYAESMSIREPADLVGYVDGAVSLHTDFYPEGSFREEVEWSVSDSSIAEVYDGEVTFSSIGTVTVTATSSRGFTDSRTISVIEPETISAGETKTADFNYQGKVVCYKFTAPEDGCYAFSSPYGGYTNAELRNANGSRTNGYSGGSFRIRRMMNRGDVYFLSVSLSSNVTASISITCEQVPYVTELSILSLPDRMTYVEGYTDNLDFDGLTLKAVWSDGEETTWSHGEGGKMRIETVSWSEDDSEITFYCGGESVSFELNIIENPVASVTLVAPSETTFIEEADGRMESGDAGYFHYYKNNRFEDAVIRINFKDGTSATASPGDEVDGYEVYIEDAQYDEPWTVGSGNTVRIGYLGATTDMSVTVLENPVASVSIAGGAAHHMYEGVDGYYSTRYNDSTGEEEEMFYYYLDSLDDVEVEINYKDGTSETAEIGDRINGYRVTVYSNQYEAPFALGENEATVSFMGRTTGLTVIIDENPVDSVELISGTQIKLIEGYGGYSSSRYNPDTGQQEQYYYYDLNRLNDVKVRINFKDGTHADAELGDNVNGYSVYASSSQYNTPFTIGNNNTFEVTYMGKSVTTSVELIENPVSSVELVGSYSFEHIENYNGYWTNLYNPETDDYDISTFIYYLGDLSDVQVKINFTDGSSKIAGVYDEINGYSVYSGSSQYGSPWIVGENSFYVGYLGKTADVPVTVIPNPVESIRILKNPIKPLIENADGNWSYYYHDDENGNEIQDRYFYYYIPELSDVTVLITYKDGRTKTAHVGDYLDGYYIGYNSDQYRSHWTLGGENYVTVSYLDAEARLPITIVPTTATAITVNSAPSKVYYYHDIAYGGENYFNPRELEGLSFTVSFSDGTSKTYTYEDIDDSGRIDGHPFNFSAEAQVIGSNTVSIYYLGIEGSYEVQAAASPIKSVEVTQAPTRTSYTDYYEPAWNGMKVTITLNSGTTKTVTLSNSNITYSFNMNFGYYATFQIGSYTAYIMQWYTNGERGYRVYVLDKYDAVPDLTFTEGKDVDSVTLENFSYTGENMTVRVAFTDGSSGSVKVTSVLNDTVEMEPGVNLIMAKTAFGVLRILTFEEEADNLYDAYVFGKYVKVGDPYEYILGDSNGDGEVNINDVTDIQRHAARLITLKGDMLRAGDVNGDGDVNIIDATLIQKYIAGYNLNYQIGESVVSERTLEPAG